MPFTEVSKMDRRRKLASLVLSDGVKVAEACRAMGVARPTGHLWVGRAREVGLGAMREESRRPHSSPTATSEETVRALLDLKAARPSWGAKKLLAKLWGDEAPLCARTADRILARNGLVGRAHPRLPDPVRFERERPNELWQADFKAVGRRDYGALSVLDDRSRFCVRFAPLPDLGWRATLAAMWDAFGEYGLPDAFLFDNGAPFGSAHSHGPTPLEARLWLLGVRTLHGRPYHPQTQGKVERFHGTAELEIGADLRNGSPERVAAAMEAFRLDYNWERPHEALDMRTPGSVYEPSPRKRPAKIPDHELPEGAVSRKVDASGKAVYRMRRYRAGKGLVGQRVEIRDEERGRAMYFAGVRIGDLEALEV